jgi:hypothetical protein
MFSKKWKFRNCKTQCKIWIVTYLPYLPTTNNWHFLLKLLLKI